MKTDKADFGPLTKSLSVFLEDRRSEICTVPT
jgi:hypothetical protein